MYYILNPDIALRSWYYIPYAYSTKGKKFADSLKKVEFELLRRCDGLKEIEPSELVSDLLSRGLILPVERGACALSDWQRYRNCENRYFAAISWMITGKCNYNCLHCFNAVDNAPLQSEFSLEEAARLLDEAQACGIMSFTITGGEPMANKHFMDIIRGIYERGMFVEEVKTNGFYITGEILDEMKSIGCTPMMSISFDGLGYHDWMRNRVGAQDETLRAIRLCLNRGFYVRIQTQINRKNIDSISPTLRMLDEMGVETTRIAPTTPVPRWELNAKGQTLTFSEYFDAATELAREYAATPKQMQLIFWQYLCVGPRSRSYHLEPVQNTGELDESFPLCIINRGMVSITAEGEAMPCMPMSGYFSARGVSFDNVKRRGLQAVLQNGALIDESCATVRDLLSANEKCGKCRYLKFCLGGCRALAGLSRGGDLRASDPTKCAFFEGNYAEKIARALPGWRCINPIEPECTAD